MNPKSRVAIFGSTGSVGVSTLEVIKMHSDRFTVFALSGFANIELLTRQCLDFQPQFAFIKPELQQQLQQNLSAQQLKTVVLSSREELIELAGSTEYDLAVCAIVGSAGILATYYAVAAGKTVLLANKESLVMAGGIIMNTAKQQQAKIIPVDSEHSAIYQSLKYPAASLEDNKVSRLILTASGGPLYQLTKSEMEQVTREQALRHPVWKMGAKISIDSATLMNKGLELIEAYWLFGAKVEQLAAVIHPQHIIHSMVEYIDGAIIAQMSVPDMKLPIAYALSLTQRMESGIPGLNFNQCNRLDFVEIDYTKFRCLQLALASLNQGGSASLVVSVANEIAVDRFLKDQISFMQIPDLIEEALNRFGTAPLYDIEEVLLLTREIYLYF